MSKIEAPFTPEQVEALNAYQAAGWFHPFTCGNEHRDPRTLIAEAEGWRCPKPRCTYRQAWAHEWMADREVAASMLARWRSGGVQ